MLSFREVQIHLLAESMRANRSKQQARIARNIANKAEQSEKHYTILLNVAISAQKEHNRILMLEPELPAYTFLNQLYEPSINYLSHANSQRTVLEELLYKHDPVFIKNHEIIDMRNTYLTHKELAIDGLLATMRLRQNPSRNHQNNEIQKSAFINAQRFLYLTHLAEQFTKNPEHEEVISFLKELPIHEEPITLRGDTKQYIPSNQ
ncbi:MAG: hypothetical protein ACMXYD_02740 [Candidatus Woesearchaeota archaeon]